MNEWMCLSFSEVKTSRLPNFSVQMSLRVFRTQQRAASIALLKVFRSSCRLGKLYQLNVRPCCGITGGDIYCIYWIPRFLMQVMVE